MNSRLRINFSDCLEALIIDNGLRPQDLALTREDYTLNLSSYLQLLAESFDKVPGYVCQEEVDGPLMVILSFFRDLDEEVETEVEWLDTGDATLDFIMRTNPEALLPLAKQIISVCNDNAVKVQSEDMISNYAGQPAPVATQEALANSATEEVVRMI